MQTFETLMLRLTTNVTVSPASSARSSSAAWRMSSIASGRVSANSAVSSAGVERRRRRAPARSCPARSAPFGAVGAARAAARDEAPEARLDHVEHALREPLGVDVLRVDAEPLGQRDAVCGEPLAHLVAATGTGARARCGRRWRSARRGRSRPRRPAAATSRRGSAGSGCRRRASAAAPRATSRSMSSTVTGDDHAGARHVGAVVQPGAPVRARRPRSRSPPAPRRSSGGAGRSSAG